jgi:large subunit ribosomal protein L18
MSKITSKTDRRRRIQLRQRKRIMGTGERPRLSVFRSAVHIYAQVIDDLAGRTLVSASTVDTSMKGSLPGGARGGNLKGAAAVGKAIAERSIEKGIRRVVFDRTGFLYHGRIRAVADAARKAGLEF